MVDWLNSFGKYRQYTYEIEPKALKILSQYGWFFDDEWVYYQTEKAKLKNMMLRVPYWLWPETGGSKFTEKWRRHANDKQIKLFPRNCKKLSNGQTQ